MKADITRLPIGTWFDYEGETYQVVSRDEYPFIEARRINALFTNFEKVEVKENTKLLDYQIKIFKL